MNNSQSIVLRRAIMTRIWCAFGLSVLISAPTFKGFLFGSSLIAFWRLVSITSIIDNLLSVRVGELPGYLWHSLVQAEVFALLAFGIIIFTLLSVGVKIPRLAWSGHTQSA
jgi:hypothetical protein